MAGRRNRESGKKGLSADLPAHVAETSNAKAKECSGGSAVRDSGLQRKINLKDGWSSAALAIDQLKREGACWSCIGRQRSNGRSGAGVKS
jgi:hypothetical protein